MIPMSMSYETVCRHIACVHHYMHVHVRDCCAWWPWISMNILNKSCVFRILPSVFLSDCSRLFEDSFYEFYGEKCNCLSLCKAKNKKICSKTLGCLSRNKLPSFLIEIYYGFACFSSGTAGVDSQALLCLSTCHQAVINNQHVIGWLPACHPCHPHAINMLSTLNQRVANILIHVFSRC